MNDAGGGWEQAMRIDLTSSGLPQPDNSGTQKTGRGAAAADTYDTAGSGTTGDRTEFSFDQPSIQSLAAQALSAQEIREATVSSLADAVSAGTYTIDPAKIAGALVSAYGGGQGD